MKSVAWNVYLKGKLINTVFHNEKADGGATIKAEDVKESLVDHDNYNPEIVVRKVRRAKP